VSGGGGAADLILRENPQNDVRFADVRAAPGTMHHSGARLRLASNSFGHANIDTPRRGLAGRATATPPARCAAADLAHAASRTAAPS
jgi:hypothetical protein